MKIIFTLCIFLFFICSCNNELHEKYIFPYGFSGNAIIIFNQSNGIEIEPKLNTIEFIFDTSGVLLVKGKPTLTNMLYSEYYYKDSTNKLIELCSKPSNKEFSGCPNTVQNDYLETFQKNDSSLKIEYNVISIGNKTARLNPIIFFDSLYKKNIHLE